MLIFKASLRFLIVWIILCSNYFFATDTIKRTRLITDEELIKAFDLNLPEFKKVKESFEKGDIKNSVIELASYIKNRNNPKYFFDARNVKERVKKYTELYPSAKKDNINNADEFIRIFGPDVDWKIPGKDKLGRNHTANTIRNLARQSKAIDIAVSYYIKEDKNYIDFLTDHVKDFINDFEAGQTETGANDVFERYYSGHRTRNWLFAHQLLLSSNAYKTEDVILMVKVFFLQGANLIDVCKDFHWGNHQLHGLAGLYEMTTMFPESPVMKKWNKIALDVIMEHITKEIKSDGFQFERASHYFKLDILNYFRIYQISKLNNITLPEPFEQRFNKMFDAIVDLATPDKSLPILQDVQGEYKPDILTRDSTDEIESNNVAELSEPKESLFMSLGAVLFNNPVYKFFAGENLPYELYWFLNDASYELYKNITAEEPSGKSVALEESGYYVMRSGRDEKDLYLVIDGGLAKFKPDHTHGGALGIIVYGNGEEILKNYRVKYSNSSYKYLKNSYAKNIALADNYLLGQNWIDNNARTGFGIWKDLPQPKVTNWFAGNSFDYFSATHNAFDTLNVEYGRSIIFIKPYFWLVLDDFKSNSMHTYQQIWQTDAKIYSDYNYATYSSSNGGIHILQTDFSDMNISKLKKYETTALQFEKVGKFDYSFSTVLFPYEKNDNKLPTVLGFERENFKIVEVGCGFHKSKTYINKVGQLKLDDVKTDADIVSVVFENNSVKSVFVLNGSYLELNDLKMSSAKRINCEIIKSGNNWEINPTNKNEIIKIN